MFRKSLISSIIFILILTGISIAQPPPPPPPLPPPPPGTSTPIDGGVSGLLIVAALYGVRRVNNPNNKK